mmetsp:Transcript_81976/g.244507  ORF Transcript_81976/g.244507 Transcript_81976/m.244507 type:complete len:204 (+) Transcript_81976:322-933(+)
MCMLACSLPFSALPLPERNARISAIFNCWPSVLRVATPSAGGLCRLAARLAKYSLRPRKAYRICALGSLRPSRKSRHFGMPSSCSSALTCTCRTPSGSPPRIQARNNSGNSFRTNCCTSAAGCSHCSFSVLSISRSQSAFLGSNARPSPKARTAWASRPRARRLQPTLKWPLGHAGARLTQRRASASAASVSSNCNSAAERFE